MMRPDIKAQWLEELIAADKKNRKMCRGRMRVRDRFDPFGLLCKIHERIFCERWHQSREDPYASAYIGATFLPPLRVRVWSGIPESALFDVAQFVDCPEEITSFRDIAKYIELRL